MSKFIDLAYRRKLRRGFEGQSKNQRNIDYRGQPPEDFFIIFWTKATALPWITPTRSARSTSLLFLPYFRLSTGEEPFDVVPVAVVDHSGDKERKQSQRS